jgi:hypothetical protein
MVFFQNFPTVEFSYLSILWNFECIIEGMNFTESIVFNTNFRFRPDNIIIYKFKNKENGMKQK